MSDIDLTEVAIKHATFIEGEPSVVYAAITEPNQLNKWFTTGSVGIPEAGESMRFAWEDWGPDRITASDDITVLEASPPKQFLFEWFLNKDWGPTTVEFTFESEQNGTIVTVREVGYGNTSEAVNALVDCATGWGEALTLLKFFVEKDLSIK